MHVLNSADEYLWLGSGKVFMLLMKLCSGTSFADRLFSQSAQNPEEGLCDWRL